MMTISCWDIIIDSMGKTDNHESSNFQSTPSYGFSYVSTVDFTLRMTSYSVIAY